MRGLSPWSDGRPLELLLIGAHPQRHRDRLRRDRPALGARGSDRAGNLVGERRRHSRAGGPRFRRRDLLVGVGEPHVRTERFRDGYFPYEGAGLKDRFEEIVKTSAPTSS